LKGSGDLPASFELPSARHYGAFRQSSSPTGTRIKTKPKSIAQLDGASATVDFRQITVTAARAALLDDDARLDRPASR
jgi:hypothetical protein